MRKADNLPPSCAVVTKSGNLNFLEPSGPVQACNGSALPFRKRGVVRNKLKYCGEEEYIYRALPARYSERRIVETNRVD